jgi:hypothetical protein
MIASKRVIGEDIIVIGEEFTYLIPLFIESLV